MPDAARENRTQVVIRYARGEGVILEGEFATFHDATVRPGQAGAEVRAWLERVAPGEAPTLPLGELALAGDVPCTADAGGFNRHTFLCGQSGSGKTYSLGLILERLLMETDLRLVILDPNSDFVRLGTVRAGADPALTERYRDATRPRHRPIRRRPGRPKAAPARGRDRSGRRRPPFCVLTPLLTARSTPSLAGVIAGQDVSALRGTPRRRRPRRRRAWVCVIRNLGIDRFTVWAPNETGSVLDAIHDQALPLRRHRPRLAADTGRRQSLVAAAVLGDLWRRRHERQPVLIVIDEAHNVCPADPPDPVIAQAAEHAIRIAAEGRKFGLYLLVSTQRPQKIAENVLSQADNLVLMRLNSLADTAFTQAVFSFVPPSLIDRAVTFRQGEALIAGKISPQPALLRFGARISEEGGADVPATWAHTTSTA